MLWKFTYKVEDDYCYVDHFCIVIASSFKEAKEYFFDYVDKECLKFKEVLIEDSIIVKELDIGNHIVYAD